MSKVKKKDSSQKRFAYTKEELKNMGKQDRALIEIMQKDKDPLRRLRGSGGKVNKLLQKKMGMDDLDVISAELSPSSDPTTAFALPMHRSLATRDDHGYGIRAHELGHIKDYQHGGRLAKLRNLAYAGAQPLSTVLSLATPIVTKRGSTAKKIGLGLSGLGTVASPYSIMKSENEAWRYADPALDALVQDKAIDYTQSDREKDKKIKEHALGTYKRNVLPQLIGTSALNMGAVLAGEHIKDIMQYGKRGVNPDLLGPSVFGTVAGAASLYKLNEIRKMLKAKKREDRIRYLEGQFGEKAKNIRGDRIKIKVHNR